MEIKNIYTPQGQLICFKHQQNSRKLTTYPFLLSTVYSREEFFSISSWSTRRIDQGGYTDRKIKGTQNLTITFNKVCTLCKSKNA